MTYARAEVWALVVKATRGAGVPVGQAEDLATAMVIAPPEAWAEIRDALDDPLRLEVAQDGDQLIFPAARAVMDGPSAIDAAVIGQEVYLGNLDAPIIFVMLCQVAERAAGCGFEYLFDDDGGLLLRLAMGAGPERELPTGPIDVPEEIIGFLHVLAAKTYVPESEASRIAGAGAGLTDND